MKGFMLNSEGNAGSSQQVTKPTIATGTRETCVKERPILFSGEMVRAILEGRKTQTRRVAKCLLPGDKNYIHAADTKEWVAKRVQQCPYGLPGDRLWVRETLRRDVSANVWYYAAGKPEEWVVVAPEHYTDSLTWAHHKERDVCVSIHMPRWASRITLEITAVRVERVREISEHDARAEGSPQGAYDAANPDSALSMYRTGFMTLWDSINAKRGFGWDANPWVWAITFKSLRATDEQQPRSRPRVGAVT